jgi:hypothetical protein
MRPQLMSAVPPLLEHKRTCRCIVALCNWWCRGDGIVWLAPPSFSSKCILGAGSTKPAHPVWPANPSPAESRVAVGGRPSRRVAFQGCAELRLPSGGDSSTVEQRTLTPLIMVRIQVPQPASPVSGVLFPGWREPPTFPRVRRTRPTRFVAETASRAISAAAVMKISPAPFRG